MSTNQSRFECLPNEILIETFGYLDAQDLFRGIYNLNTRLNGLLKSINDLSLTLSPSDQHENLDDAPFPPYVSTLIVNKQASVIVGLFPNLRHLILHWLANDVLDKLEFDYLPYLEYLHIDSRRVTIENWDGCIFDKIFTNGFPQLKYCSLSKMDITPSITLQPSVPSLNILKVQYIDIIIYQKILSSCPNLNLFEFALSPRDHVLNNIENHVNMKTLVIKITSRTMVQYTTTLKMYLSCVSNLKRLNIHFEIYSITNAFSSYITEWFLGMINDSHLPELRRVNLKIRPLESMGEYDLHQLQEDFKIKHQNSPYKIKLIID